MSLTVGSLFSGIGGLDLGLERAGMVVRWQSEIDPYACRVLRNHWPDVPNLGDITTVNWGDVERVDVICGGYPCQPFSLAGVRFGEHDPRHLWPHFAAAIRQLRPRFALLENVAGHLSLGFGRVLGDLAEIGYDAEWDCIPAAAVGAPHRRDRVFVIARPEQSGHVADAGGRWGSGDELRAGGDVARRSGADVADADRSRRTVLQGRSTVAELAGWRTTRGHGWWRTEPDVGRVADGVPARVDRLRCLGNAVVPQVAELIGRRLMEVAA